MSNHGRTINKGRFNTSEVYSLCIYLIIVNKAVNPRTTAEGSIPGMLKAFQNEWDALMMESFTLKKHLENVRQELSQALYQYDAACRVIARLIKERDEARQQLANLHATGVSSSSNMEEEGEGEGGEVETGISKKIQQEVNDLSKQLFETRKNRKIPESLETIEDLKEFKCLNSYAIHKSNKIGITCIDINPHNDNEILTGGIDHEIKLFDKTEGKVITTLKGHTKPLTDVLFALNNIILSSSSDKTIRIWTPTEKSTYKSNILACHTDEVYGLTVHPLQRYFVSNSKDNSWCFNDIENIKCISKFENNENNSLLYSSYSSPMFHPDGVLLAIGYTTGKSSIFDIRKQGIVATFEGHNKDITGITFSENGYHMFTGSLDGTAKLWDLRKCQVIQTVSGEGEVTAVKYDRSGEYLLIGGNDVRLLKVNGSNKKDEICKIVKTFDDNTKPITGLAFGNDCKYIATTSLDKNLRIYSV